MLSTVDAASVVASSVYSRSCQVARAAVVNSSRSIWYCPQYLLPTKVAASAAVAVVDSNSCGSNCFQQQFSSCSLCCFCAFCLPVFAAERYRWVIARSRHRLTAPVYFRHVTVDVCYLWLYTVCSRWCILPFRSATFDWRVSVSVDVPIRVRYITVDVYCRWRILPLTYITVDVYYRWRKLPLTYVTVVYAAVNYMFCMIHLVMLPCIYVTIEVLYGGCVLMLTHVTIDERYRWLPAPLAAFRAPLGYRGPGTRCLEGNAPQPNGHREESSAGSITWQCFIPIFKVSVHCERAVW